MNTINRLSYRIFGSRIHKRREKYHELHKSLRQARIKIPYEIYVARCYFLSVVLGLAGGILGFIISQVFVRYYGAPSIHTGMPYGLVAWFLPYKETIFISAATLCVCLISGLLAYYILISSPSFVANARKNKIDITLVHAVSYMYALSKGNLNLVDILSSLSKQTNIYMESADEAGYILMDCEYLGTDLLTALRNARDLTLSEKYRDFLDNLISVIEGGGDLPSYFNSRVTQYHSIAAEEQSLFLETLGVIAETYITVLVAAPIFLITILIAMGLMGGVSMKLLILIIYIVIPVSAIAFSYVLTIIAISDNKIGEVYLMIRKIKEYGDVRIKPIFEKEKIERLQKSLTWTRITAARKNPLKPFLANPFRVFYVSVPVAVILLILKIRDLETMRVEIIDDYIIMTILVILVPFSIIYELEMKYVRKIEQSIPEFLRMLASLNESGISLTHAIGLLTKASIGALSSEIKIAWKDIQFGVSTVEALYKLERRVKTLEISKTITLLAKASETTTNIKEILRIAASDAALSETLRKSKFSTLFTYILIAYIAFGVFLITLFVLAKSFLPMIPSEGKGALVGQGFAMGGIDIDFYKLIFFHASLIQGFASGMITGQILGNVYSGLKHSIIMVIVAYIAFTVFI